MSTPSKAYNGQGFLVEIGTMDAVTTDAAADVFLEVGEVNDADPPTESSGTIDATHLQSSAMEFISSILDPGEGSLTVNFINDDAGQQACRTALRAQQLRNFRFTFPTTMTPNVILAKCLVTNFRTPVRSNDKVTGTINLKASGLSEWGNA